MVKTPSVRNVNDINIKPSPAIVAVKGTDVHLIYEAAPPSLPRSLFPALCIMKYRRTRHIFSRIFPLVNDPTGDFLAFLENYQSSLNKLQL